MPHYDYICEECGNKFELFQKMNDSHVTVCPACGGKVKRLIGKGAGTIFKGSGFYQTDYKNQPEKKEGVGKNPAAEKKEVKPADSAAEKVSKKENSSE